MKIIDKILDDKNEASYAVFWQLVGPLFVVCAFALMPHSTLLFILGTVGLFLSAKFCMKGFYASVAALLFGLILSFFSTNSDFLWTVGIEGSFALAFFITAQNADRQNALFLSLFSQVETKSSVISNLEDEVSKSKQELTDKNLALQEKIESMQKGLDEVLSEQSSIATLNEVLRKTTATHMARAKAIEESLLNAQIALDFEKKERQATQASLQYLESESAIVQENKRLIDEINAIRLDREQTHSINATLARLHAKESLKAKEAIEELERCRAENNEQSMRVEESRALFKATETEKDANLSEINSLKERLKESEALLNQKESEKELLQEECKALKNRPSHEIDLSQYVEKETFLHVQDKVKQLGSIDSLYKQLKVQFDEKNEVLHATRKELFQLDNAYQTLQKQVDLDERMDLKEISQELTGFEKKIASLEEENKELQSLITTLSQKD